ncbi:hypothetical protein V6N12_049794 [Hibiscus sabdariffa]|uniref:Uncharacterized protein n=1 Tax=Hibiscus sabdariffa TaxID=183260 RepID=A0ABR2GAR6_9ROSI
MGEKWVEVIDELRSKFSGPGNKPNSNTLEVSLKHGELISSRALKDIRDMSFVQPSGVNGQQKSIKVKGIFIESVPKSINGAKRFDQYRVCCSPTPDHEGKVFRPGSLLEAGLAELMLLDLDDGGTFLELDRAANLFVKLSFGFVDRTDNLKAVRCIIEGAHHVVVFLAWLFSVLI